MNEIKIITHNGSYHADDVFAVATLLLMLGEKGTSIVRTRDELLIEKGDYVVDVGGVYDPERNRFDHHQIGGAGIRSNSIPYASFGLVWKKYGESISGSQEVANAIEERLVMPIDANDSGIGIAKYTYPNIRAYTIGDYFYSFVSDATRGEADIDETFKMVVGLAKNLLEREVDHTRLLQKSDLELNSIYSNTEDKRLLVLDEEMSWAKFAGKEKDILMVVYPSTDKDRWRAKAVKVDSNTFDYRVLFPESWAGKKDAELENVSGVPGAKFCHNSRFTVVATTKEAAIELALKALN
jgi:uncharacterized UPF0160 family protein